jgi:hypothetical protein
VSHAQPGDEEEQSKGLNQDVHRVFIETSGWQWLTWMRISPIRLAISIIDPCPSE